MITFAATLRVSGNPVSLYAFPHKAVDLQNFFGRVGRGLDNGDFLFRSQTPLDLISVSILLKRISQRNTTDV